MKKPPTVNNQEHLQVQTQKLDLDYVLKRLLKLKPATRKTAVNAIKSMFQFQSPMSDQQASKTLDSLGKRRMLIIDANDKVVYPLAPVRKSSGQG